MQKLQEILTFCCQRDFDLTYRQTLVLLTIQKNDGLILHDLATALDCSLSTTSKILNDLKKMEIKGIPLITLKATQVNRDSQIFITLSGSSFLKGLNDLL